MALPELIGRLESDAKARADALLGQAREEIGKIEAEADRTAGKLRDEELAVRRTRRLAKLERERAEARAAARSTALRARELLIDRAFSRARQLLPSLAADERVARWLLAAIAEAGGYLGAFRLRCAPSLAAVVARAGVAAALDASLPLGARLESTDAAVSVELTLERQLERSRPALSIALAKELP